MTMCNCHGGPDCCRNRCGYGYIGQFVPYEPRPRCAFCWGSWPCPKPECKAALTKLLASVEVKPERKPYKCPACDGRGKRTSPEFAGSWVDCHGCFGKGFVWAPES